MGNRDRREAVRRGSRWSAVAVAVLVALAVASSASAAATQNTKLSSAERAFKKAYVALVPNLNSASAAIITAVRNAGKDTDAQVVTIFTRLARRWTTATRPLLALKAPAPDAGLFAAVTTRVPKVEADLLATAQAGRTHSVSAGRTAGEHLATDFNALGVAVKALKTRLGLP